MSNLAHSENIDEMLDQKDFLIVNRMPAFTLRDAVLKAHAISMQSMSPGYITRPNGETDEVVADHIGIHFLCKHLGLKVSS